MYNIYTNVGHFGFGCYFIFFRRRFFCLHVIEVFAVSVHATLSNSCAVHSSIMETCTRWKITKSDIINFLVRSSLGWKCDNSTKSGARKEVHPNINSSYIPCTLPLIVVIFCGCLITSRNLFAITKRKGFFQHALVEDKSTKHVETS